MYIIIITLATGTEFMLEVPCDFNFRGEHCVCRYFAGPCTCNSALENGLVVIHGNNYGFEHPPLNIIHNHVRKVSKIVIDLLYS